MSILAFSQSQAQAEKEEKEKEKKKEEKEKKKKEKEKKKKEKEKEKEEQYRVQEQHIQECSRIKKMLQDSNEGQTCQAFTKWEIGLPINSETVYKLQQISDKETLETMMNPVIPGN